jgi:hypothetical protein
MRRGLPVLVLILLAAGATDARAMIIRYTNAAAMGLTAEDKAAIERIANATDAEARRQLSNLPRDLVLIVDVGRNVVQETGESGVASSPTLIRWYVDHRRPGGAGPIITARLRSALLQLAHHVIREWVSSGVDGASTFWDAVVAEGLANAFAREISGTPAPWADYPGEVTSWLAELRMMSDADVAASFDLWLTELPDGRRFAAYKVGTYLADEARRNSGRSFEQLAVLATADVLELAGR